MFDGRRLADNSTPISTIGPDASGQKNTRVSRVSRLHLWGAPPGGAG